MCIVEMSAIVSRVLHDNSINSLRLVSHRILFTYQRETHGWVSAVVFICGRAEQMEMRRLVYLNVLICLYKG